MALLPRPAQGHGDCLGRTGWPAAASPGENAMEPRKQSLLVRPLWTDPSGEPDPEGQGSPCGRCQARALGGFGSTPRQGSHQGWCICFSRLFADFKHGALSENTRPRLQSRPRAASQARPAALSPAHPPAQGRRPRPPVAVICPRAGSTQSGAQGHAE